jgi:hypothetical protein
VATGKPDTDNGWFKLAHEMAAALDVAGFGKVERIVLNTLLAQVFGPAKARAGRLSPKGIGDRYGLAKQSAERAIRSLELAGVIARAEGEGDREYTLNKLYRGWKDSAGKSARFTAKELDAIAGASDFAMSFRSKAWTPPVNGNVDRPAPVNSNVDTYPEPVNSNVDRRSTAALTAVNSNVDQNGPPIRKETGDKEKAAAIPSSRGIIPIREAAGGAVIDRHLADAVALCELHSGDDPGEAQGKAVQLCEMHAKAYGAYAVLKAVEHVVSVGPDRFYPYLARILRAWQAEGKLPKAPPKVHELPLLMSKKRLAQIAAATGRREAAV